MARVLPYFKFTPGEWMTGDIVFESFEVQGLFINVCALYWQREGSLTITDINNRYKKPKALQSLLNRFISVDEKDPNIVHISFLDEQFTERFEKSQTNKKNGALGGRPKLPKNEDFVTETKPNALFEEAKKSNKEEEKEQKEEQDKERLHKKGIAEFLLFESAKETDPLFYDFVDSYKKILLETFPKDFMNIQVIPLMNFSEIAREMIQLYEMKDIKKVFKNAGQSTFWKPQLYNLAAIHKNFMAIKNIEIVKTGKGEEKPSYKAPAKIDFSTLE
ncbi:MAG: hypothetical protein V4687_15920 [Bacteroidota bacterium]